MESDYPINLAFYYSDCFFIWMDKLYTGIIEKKKKNFVA